MILPHDLFRAYFEIKKKFEEICVEKSILIIREVNYATKVEFRFS